MLKYYGSINDKNRPQIIKTTQLGLKDERERAQGENTDNEDEFALEMTNLRPEPPTAHMVFLNTVRAAANTTAVTCEQNIGQCLCRACCWSCFLMGAGAVLGAAGASLCTSGSTQACLISSGSGAGAGVGTSCFLAYAFPTCSPLCLLGDGFENGNTEVVVDYKKKKEAQSILAEAEKLNDNSPSLLSKIFCCH